jgi:O-antigen biosynthesis protein
MTETQYVGQEEFRPRPEIVSLVPASARRILDVGCGPGLTGEALLRRGAEEVWGVERDPDLAKEAQRRLTRVVSIDVERDGTAGLPLDYFDTIIYADVLEHMIDPWRVLREHRSLLRTGGTVVTSTPNVRHYRVWLPLVLRGRWDYTPAGLLSEGHVRFFTTRTLRALFAQAGFRVVRTDGVYGRRARTIARVSRGLLEDLVVFQRLFVARRVD